MAIDDTCYWLGQPINAMTREQLQDALIECKLALMLKKNELTKLRYLYLEIKYEIAPIRRDNVIDLRSIC
jgi:hypothetical protein